MLIEVDELLVEVCPTCRHEAIHLPDGGLSCPEHGYYGRDFLRPEARDVPPWVVDFCRRAEVRTDQVRWCDWCHCVAYAIDHHQVSRLDAVGFDSGLCPACKSPAA